MRIIAWGIHLYTAMGLVAAAVIAVFIVQGTTQSLYWALALMWLANIIDGSDGALARHFSVKEVLPQFDGRRLDDLTDFLTYTFLPLLFCWRARLLTGSMNLWLIVPLLASAYGFCQSEAKTDDGYFLGFPSYWNVIVLYLFLLEPGALASVLIMMGFAFLTFIPARYLYPTQPGRLNHITLVLSILWAILLGWVFWRLLYPVAYEKPFGEGLRLVIRASLIFPAYYLIASWFVSVQIAWTQRSTRKL